MPELQHLLVIFWTNLVSNISIKEPKTNNGNAKYSLFGLKKVQVNAHFG